MASAVSAAIPSRLLTAPRREISSHSTGSSAAATCLAKYSWELRSRGCLRIYEPCLPLAGDLTRRTVTSSSASWTANCISHEDRQGSNMIVSRRSDQQEGKQDRRQEGKQGRRQDRRQGRHGDQQEGEQDGRQDGRQGRHSDQQEVTLTNATNLDRKLFSCFFKLMFF
jgi:hypothetical protein